MPQVDDYRFPSDRQYDPETHLWVKRHDDRVRIGVDDFEQEAAGTYQRVLLKEPGEEVPAGDELVNLESAKFVGSKPAPIGGEVVAVNRDVVREPQQINLAPYDHWLLALAPADNADFGRLVGGDDIEPWAREEIDEEQRRTTALEGERCPPE